MLGRALSRRRKRAAKVFEIFKAELEAFMPVLLKNGGFILVDTDGHITLTDEGREVAETIFERHTILTEALTRLGVDPEIASEDACKIEHDLSAESFDAIRRHAEECR